MKLIFISIQKNALAIVGLEPTTLRLLVPRSNQLSYTALHFFEKFIIFKIILYIIIYFIITYFHIYI